MFDDISVYALMDEISRLKRERDAAVDDIRELAHAAGCICDVCINHPKYNKCEPCLDCSNSYRFAGDTEQWQWRGVRNVDD
jgi:hypothetical protein